MESSRRPDRHGLAGREIRGRPFDQSDHPAGHEARRAHRLPSPGDLGDLHHPSAGPGLDATASSTRRHFELASAITCVDDDLYAISLHKVMIPRRPQGQTD